MSHGRGLLALALLAATVACDAPARAQGGAPVAAADPPTPAPGDAPVADPAPPPLTLPAGWSPLPEVAEASHAAATRGAGDRPVRVRAWGDPGVGCFVAVVDLTGTRDEPLAAIGAELRATLGGMVDVEGWTYVEGPVAEVSATFARPPQRGALRGRIVAAPAGVPRATIAACFYNEREPARCRLACDAALASLEAPRISP
ncbi:MAG: hypothetical protein KJZ91_20100 [Myxococcales bacterium]|nr:hypothetical protein [Myxococcales bacterium]